MSRSLSQGSGRLEVLGPEDGIALEAFGLMTRPKSIEKADILTKGLKNDQIGILEVLGSGEAAVAEPIETMSRPGSTGSRQGSASSSKKSYTPTKQISLSAAKASQEKHGVYVKKLGNKDAAKPVETNSRPYNCLQENIEPVADTRRFNAAALKVSFQTQKNNATRKENVEPAVTAGKVSKEQMTNTVSPTEVSPPHKTMSRINTQLSETSDEDNSDEDEESEPEVEEERKAPIELLGEFLKAIMDQDYKLASKLCQMILIYEPGNSEANQFFPLIKEKMLIDEQTEKSEGDEETDESDEETSESDEDDSDDSESDEDSDDESEDSLESDESS